MKFIKLRNNIEDFNKPIYTEEEIKEFRENYGGHPYGREYFDLNLPGYDYKKNDEYQHSFYNYTMYDNTKEMFLVSTYFASEEEFYQACYDVLLEIMKTKPKDIALSDCLVPKVSDACIDNLELSIEEGDYSLLFDAIMNQTFAFIYTDDNGIWYRIEYADYMLQEDGSRNTILTITSKCTFDDETKYQQ